MKKVYFFAPLSAVRKRTRLAKMARWFAEANIDLEFFGWERQPGEFEKFRTESDRVRETIVMHGGGYANKKARAMYVLWMIQVFVRVLFLPKGACCWCLGWETAFPARLAALVSGAQIIFDDADRFSLIFNLPPGVSELVVALEKWTSRKCLVHVVPGLSRYEWRHGNMFVLRNAPMEADYAGAAAFPPIALDAPLTIYVNGWIAWDTGARILLAALREFESRSRVCRVLLAGRIAADSGAELRDHPWTTHHGEVPQVRALALYRQAHVSLTLYDPAVAINRHAESNKWGDCVVLSAPFIVNEEVVTARKFTESGAAFSFPYEDWMALANLLETIDENRQVLAPKAEALANFRSEYRPFEIMFGELVSFVRTRL